VLPTSAALDSFVSVSTRRTALLLVCTTQTAPSVVVNPKGWPPTSASLRPLPSSPIRERVPLLLLAT
jgi:hypothetical protein